MGIAGLCAAMGAALWVPPLACGGVALCGFGVMAAAMRFNVWFFARLQTVLPQAQLDRFMVRMKMGYPDFNSQVRILRDRRMENPLTSIAQVTDAAAVRNMQREVDQLRVSDSILEYITHLAQATRENAVVQLGVSPRGALAVLHMAQVFAYVSGRDYVIPEDAAQIFGDVCAHRLVLSPKAKLAGKTQEDVIREVLSTVRMPLAGA